MAKTMCQDGDEHLKTPWAVGLGRRPQFQVQAHVKSLCGSLVCVPPFKISQCLALPLVTLLRTTLLRVPSLVMNSLSHDESVQAH